MTSKTDWLVKSLLQSDPSHFVIRFDHRDVGLSTSYPPSQDDNPVYTLEDMVDDIVGLIHHLGLQAVHVFGASMGGPLAWMTAARLPHVVKSLALGFTSPVGRQQLPSDKLPPVHMEGQWLLGEAWDPPENLDDDEGWLKHYVSMDLALACKAPTDEEREESRRDCEVTYARERKSGTMWTKSNHSGAAGVRWPRELLKEVQCQTVVIHGEKDQIFPIQHAEALREDVNGRLVVLPECGHEIPHRVRHQLVEAVLENMDSE